LLQVNKTTPGSNPRLNLKIKEHHKMNELQTYEAESREIIANMPGAEIAVTDQASYEAAGEILREIASRKKEIKDKFAEPKKAAAASHKAICNLENELLAKVSEHENSIRQKMAAYWQAEQQRIAAEQERKRKEAEEMARLAMAAESSGDTETAAEAIAVAAMTEASVTVAPKAAGVSMRKVWRAKVIDIDKVPREYMTVDQASLDAVAKATKGKIKIPGVEFVEEISATVRAK
jgi:hypothetical protein